MIRGYVGWGPHPSWRAEERSGGHPSSSPHVVVDRTVGVSSSQGDGTVWWRFNLRNNLKT